SLLANNVDLKAQIQEKIFAIADLKNDLRKLKGNSVDTKFAKTSVLGKPVLQSLRNQSVVRQPNAFKSERPQMSKQQFASQVYVNKNLSRPVTQHYLPKRRESIFAKPDHMIAVLRRHHGPSDAMHNPSQPFEFLSKLSHLSRRYTRYLLTSHSEIVDIEKEAICSSLRLLKPKRTNGV
ncbi:hypothetical protein Tco_1396959, partial [Tanacetum coccineum]